VAVVVDALEQIATDWQALTPPDRVTKRYHEIDGKRFLDGASGDRSFYFEIPTRAEPHAESGVRAAQVWWNCVGKVRIGGAGRSVRSLQHASADEGNQLARSIEARSTWPASVLAVVTRDVNGEMDEAGNDIILSVNFDVLTIEV
jgi:hypothetical protein